MPKTDVKQAIRTAIDYLQSVFDEVEHVEDLRLEEVEFDDDENVWLITVSMLREPPQDEQAVYDDATAGAIVKMLGVQHALEKSILGSGARKLLKRVYKVVEVDAENGAVKSMKIRVLVS